MAIEHRMFHVTCAIALASKKDIKDPHANGAINRAKQLSLMVVVITNARCWGSVALNTKMVTWGTAKEFPKVTKTEHA